MLSTFLIALLVSRPVRTQDHHNPTQEVDQADSEYFYQFVTRPDLGAPKWDVEVYDHDSLGPGYWFVSPYANLQQTTFPIWNGPHIYDQKGELIWSGAPYFEHKNVHDFRVSRLNDTDVLTLEFPRDGIEEDGVIFDHTYNVQKKVDMVGPNDGPNMHDFNLVDNGKHVLMLTTNELEDTRIRLPWFNGTCKVHWQGFKKVDVATGETVFEWNSKGHVDVSESTFRPLTDTTFGDACKHEWDITHFNAIDRCDDGDYLLSARHTDTLYKISPNGTIVWRLGGIYSDFEFRDARARFSRQHHARCRSANSTHTTVTVFDNAIGTGKVEQASSGESWGLHISLRTDSQPMTADLIGRYEHPPWGRSLMSQSRGSVQILPNSNVFVGWVITSLLSEYTAGGRLLMQANMRLRGTNSYRSYKFPWVGKPSDPPDVHAAVAHKSAQSEDLRTIVHVSWNGATEVATWKLLHTSYDGEYSELIASSPRQGFETQLRFDGFARHVVAVALDIEGKELGRSKIVRTELPPDLGRPHTVSSETAWIEHAHNQSLSWEVPYEERLQRFWADFKWVSIGILFGVGAICGVAVIILRRRATSKRRLALWWRDRKSPSYQSMVSSDGGDDDDDHGDEGESMLPKEEESGYS